MRIESGVGRTVVLASALAVGGCATYGGYQPTVDTTHDANAQSISRDRAECQQLAKQASGGTARQAATGGVVGGLLGAAAGAAIGAATGNPGKGAAIGGAAGGIGGGAYKGLSADEAYKQAYGDCMRNRGHTVVD
jgi:outer membrane lipoprotein SlyB